MFYKAAAPVTGRYVGVVFNDSTNPAACVQAGRFMAGIPLQLSRNFSPGVRKVAPWSELVLSSDRIETMIRNGASYGINAVAGATKGKTLTVPVGSAVIAKGVQDVVDYVPKAAIDAPAGSTASPRASSAASISRKRLPPLTRWRRPSPRFRARRGDRRPRRRSHHAPRDLRTGGRERVGLPRLQGGDRRAVSGAGTA